MFEFPIHSIIKIIDGDSLRLLVDLGFKLRIEADIRINGVDTPEVRGEQKKYGRFVREQVKQWLESRWLGGLTLLSYELDKYGRVLGDIRPNLPTREPLSSFLLENRLARPYEGGTRGSWTPEELAPIIEQME